MGNPFIYVNFNSSHSSLMEARIKTEKCFYDSDTLSEEEQFLLQKAGISPLPVSEKSEHVPLFLTRVEERVTLIADGRPFYIDFSSGKTGYRLLHGGEGKRSPLARACGLHLHGPTTVTDATAGLGEDGLLLARLGCRVKMYERSPIVFILLQDALMRARVIPELIEALNRIELESGDSIELLAEVPESARPDICYLDPMFVPRKKSALVKHDLRLVRSVVGPDTDSGRLLKIAREKARRQVVVKRMKNDPVLSDIQPHHVVRGKTVRYDVYNAL